MRGLNHEISWKTLTSTYEQNAESPTAMRRKSVATACFLSHLPCFQTSFPIRVGMIESRWCHASHCESHTPSPIHLGRLRKMGLAASEALIDSDLPGLKLVSKGKVRDIYETPDPNHLLFVASDRISAYDVVLKNVRAHHTPPGVG